MYSLRSVFALAQNFMGPCLKLIIYFISFLNLVNNTRVKQDLQWKKKRQRNLHFLRVVACVKRLDDNQRKLQPHQP